MTFAAFLTCMLIILFLFALSCVVFGPPVPYYGYADDEEIVTTTTTTTHYDEPTRPNIVGDLRVRYTEGDTPQRFVIDPVDGQKFWLNSNDDMYEDADGKIWRLIA
ncbi:hypothetical protein OJF2_50360 [Aquisphaera giovannonii]|uniref:Uncharacterized protein n=1 Tax=Aquisphaera giovannonii TaxID=406548 RepID=A0A5B9W721_9BACT|nr:hypothetical protein [Aquisphaera giovannonii]QEH36472.1 hypothetical protein OJF2_50360 [Aquisphaera giovannonii]